MSEQPTSSRIVGLSWGQIEVEGGIRFKDAKLYPGGSREWDWRETGTAHIPGIQPADVEELLQKGARRVVLSRGIYRRLQVCPETPRMRSAGMYRRCNGKHDVRSPPPGWAGTVRQDQILP